MTDLTIDIGIDEADRQAITEGLSRLLADTYTLYLKTHNYHWNVTSLARCSTPCTSCSRRGTTNSRSPST